MRDIMKDALKKAVDRLTDPEATVEDMKEVVCKFFRKGKHPDCQGCEQDEDKVRSCTKMYTDTILERPMMQWSPAFSEIRDREGEKIDVRSVSSMGMFCDNCYAKDNCVLFKVKSTCAIDWKVEESALASTTAGMDYLIRMQFVRVERARAFEEMDGGMPDANLSAEMKHLQELLSARAEMDVVRITQKTTMQIPGNATPAQENVLLKFFGNKNQQQQLPESTPATPVIDVTNSAKVETIKIIPKND